MHDSHTDSDDDEGVDDPADEFAQIHSEKLILISFLPLPGNNNLNRAVLTLILLWLIDDVI